MCAWIAMVDAFGIVFVGAAVLAAIERRWDDVLELGLGTLAAIGLLVFFFALAAFATRAGKRDEQWLRDWLEHRLDALNRA